LNKKGSELNSDPFLIRYFNLYFGNVGCLVAFRSLSYLIFHSLTFF
jgi:hypothetical protein